MDPDTANRRQSPTLQSIGQHSTIVDLRNNLDYTLSLRIQAAHS